MEKIKKTWTNLISSTAQLVLTGYQLKVALFELSKQCPYFCKYCYTENGPTGKGISLPIARKIIKRLKSDNWMVRTLVDECVPEIEQFLPLIRKLQVKDINSAGDPLVLHPEWFDLFKKHKVDTIRITVFPTEALHFEWTHRKSQMALKAIQMAPSRYYRFS
jgi:MoaA/NifB/PqqE/SkfB family radical SAM enzyme